MNTQFWVVQAFNGISYGALLFLIGSGLSLIFGVMRIVNLSHGAYFLWGGYIALSVIQYTGSWALSLPIAALAVAAIGIAIGKRRRRTGALRKRSPAQAPTQGCDQRNRAGGDEPNPFHADHSLYP